MIKYVILPTLFFFLILLVPGCKQQDLPQAPDRSWSKLIITSERSTDIIISNDDDTSMIYVYHLGSFFSPLPKNAKIKVDTFKAYFSKVERDTLFSLVNELIVHPVKASHFCTEYVGSLRLIIYYGEQFKQIGEYSSVCDWNLLSVRTEKLHDLLRRRIKKVYLGEGGAGISHVSN